MTETEHANQRQPASPQGEIDHLNRQAWAVAAQNPEQAAEYISQARERLYECKMNDRPYPAGQADMLRNQALLQLQHGAYESALRLALEALDILRKNGHTDRQPTHLHLIGQIHCALGNYAEALQWLLDALKLSDVCRAPLCHIHILNSIGQVYLSTEQYDSARNCFEQILDALPQDDPVAAPLRAEALGNLCVIHTHRQDFKAALSAGHASLDGYRDHGLFARSQRTLLALSRVYRAVGDHALSHAYLDEAMALVQDSGQHRDEIDCYLARGRTFAAEDRTSAALESLNKGLALSLTRKVDLLSLRLHEALYIVYKQAGQCGKALYHFEQFHALQTGVVHREADTRLQSLRVLHEVESTRQEAEIERLRHAETQAVMQREIEAREHMIEELDSFARTVAHDLKSPLSLITGYGELVMNDLMALDHPDLTRRMDLILKAGFKTNRIIEELLLLSGVRQQRITPRPVDMGYVIQEVESRILQITLQQPVEIIKPRTWPLALGYAPWIEEVWANYISNAIKYGGDPPRLRLGCTVEPNGYVRFWVRDNGQGIDPHVQSQLFQAFERLGRTKVTGYGLGLSIVKQIVEKLGGEVGIDSQPGQGSTFSFTLPAVPQHATVTAV